MSDGASAAERAARAGSASAPAARSDFLLRAATIDDVPLILRGIRALAADHLIEPNAWGANAVREAFWEALGHRRPDESYGSSG